LADGAIGYLENDEEDLKIFDIIANSLKSGGKHFMDIGNAEYAERHFPTTHWESGTKMLALAQFGWDAKTKCMTYGGAKERPEERNFDFPLPWTPRHRAPARGCLI
jgi:hypothetical protein